MATAKRQLERRRLTPRQLEILTLIRDWRRRDGYAPTMQEIADHLNVSKVTVFEHIGALVDKGLLRRLPHKARSLEVTPDATFPDESPGRLPLVGRIAAGAPIEAIENEGHLNLDELFGRKHPTFALRVEGDSMIDDLISPGDFVVVERREEVRNGETVVALIDGEEATLKRFYREGKRIRLQPANANYAPIYPERVEIQGVVVGLIRQY